MSAKSREIIYTNDLNNPRYSVTPLLRSYSRKTDRSENHRFLRGMEAVSQRDVVRYPEKNIKSLNSIGLLFKKPELFKIGCRSSEIADVERHRPHGGGSPLSVYTGCMRTSWGDSYMYIWRALRKNRSIWQYTADLTLKPCQKCQVIELVNKQHSNRK